MNTTTAKPPMLLLVVPDAHGGYVFTPPVKVWLWKKEEADRELMYWAEQHERDLATDPGYKYSPPYWQSLRELKRSAKRVHVAKDKLLWAILDDAMQWWPPGEMGSGLVKPNIRWELLRQREDEQLRAARVAEIDGGR